MPRKVVQKNQKGPLLSPYNSLVSKNPYLKEIINSDPEDPKRFVCLLCSENQQPNHQGTKESVKGAFTWLKKHLGTKSHANFTPLDQRSKLNEVIDSLGRQSKILNRITDDSLEEDEVEIKAIPALGKHKEAELYLELAKFIVDNHLPFGSVEFLLNFIKRIVSNYEESLLQRAHIGRTTLTKVVSECIGGTLKQKLLEELKNSPFSIMIDASSDIYKGKYLAILVRYLSNSEYLPVTKLVSIIEIGSESTGEVLYKKISEEFFTENEDLKQNILGICSDNESTMISSRDNVVNPKGKGVANRLINDMNHVIHVRDRCHLYNLICEDALKTFPV